MNISLVSLHVFSLYSISPLYMINSNDNKRISLIADSLFSHSFTQILYSTTNFHSTKIHNNVFMHIINTPVVFSSYVDGYCNTDAECCVSKDYYFKKGQIIENVSVSNLSIPQNFDYKNCYFFSNCGDIKMTKCQFSYCYTSQPNGGGILIQENCTVILHNCIFDHCHSGKNGGAAAIATEIKFNDKPDTSGVVTDDPIHIKTQRLDIQYSCFSDCYTDNKYNEGYGSVIIMGANDVTFFYASTVNCAKVGQIPKGAQFDILSDSISSQFINVTGGQTIYCGSLEYREATRGFFQYQTITNLVCKYAMCFTSVNIENLAITSCNVYKNKAIRPYWENPDDNPPALVFVRKLDLLVKDFYFKENDLGDNGKFAAKENVDKLTITLDHCYADTNNNNYWNQDYVKTIYCVFDNKEITTFPLRQLKLGHCQGDVLPGQMIITSFFTASSVFTKTGHFSNSKEFSESGKFSLSKKFSESNDFTRSNDFTNSKGFTPSSGFTKTDEFSKTDEFTQSDEFTASSVFTSSSVFTESHTFTPSHKFNATNYFTASNTFTPSYKFTKSDLFSYSDEFSKSAQFSESKKFSKSEKFSLSSMFSESNDFTRSSFFTESDHFTNTKGFSESNDFTHSLLFSDSDHFTKSSFFTESDHFTRSSFFTASDHFTCSLSFTGSMTFTKSDAFSFSLNFTESDKFIPVILPGGSDTNKGNKGVIIGAVVGSVGGAAVIAAIAAFFIIRHRRRIADGAVDMMGETNASVTVDNALQSVMNNDDPFADDFVL